MLSMPAGIDAKQVVAELRARELYCDARGSTLRISPGFVTREAAVETLLGELERMLGQGKRLLKFR